MKPCILIVEDDSAFSALLTTMLEMQGYAVPSADSTLGTLEQVRRVRPCAIVLGRGSRIGRVPRSCLSCGQIRRRRIYR